MKIGIVIADEMEYLPLLQFAQTKGCTQSERHGRQTLSYTDGEKTVTAVRSGIGKVNAATAAAYLLADKNCDVLLNAGLSGAVSGLRREDIVVGSSFVECDFDLTAIGRPLGAKPDQPYIYRADETLLSTALSIRGVRSAVFGTGDLFLTDKEKGKRYHELFGVQAFDMETAAIASVCHFDGVPFLSFRKISDTADDTAENDYRDMNDRCETDLTSLLDTVIRLL